MNKFYHNIKHKLNRGLKHRFDFKSVNRRFSLVFFTTFSSFIFLNFFEPFGLYYDKSIPAQEVFVELFIATTIAFVMLSITQFVLRPILNFFISNIWVIFCWFLFEAVIVAIVWSFLDYVIEEKSQTFIYFLVENFLAYVLIMFLPYFLFIAYIYFRDKVNVVETDRQIVQKERSNISIKDETGDTKLIVDSENLLFMQSSDNYVEINYIESNIPKKILIRNTLKNLEIDMQHFPIIRCHRSFMINTKRIESARKTASGFDVKMQLISAKTIPVSRSHVSELKKRTASFN